MNSRTEILKAIYDAKVPVLPRPKPFVVNSSPGSTEKFIELVTAIGGTVDRLPVGRSLSEYLGHTPQYKSIVEDSHSIIFRDQSIEQLGINELVDEDTTSPKEFTLSILSGEFGVSENGAVWVCPKSLRARLALVSTEHLILVIPEIIVPTLHEAYTKISIASGPTGYFIAGPSKTADIEQNLVIGAQGARSLLVLLK
jgi:L-lactate dehydrogenase complex protein LldG